MYNAYYTYTPVLDAVKKEIFPRQLGGGCFNPLQMWVEAGLSEDRAGWARTDLYTDITMTNFGQNPVQATKTNK